jgi:long-chain acyl-CoA synthetase
MLGCTARADSNLPEIIAGAAPYRDSPIPDPDATFTMLYTSGTTGNAKGVMHSHATPGHVVPEILEGCGLKPGTRFFSFLPMTHAAERILVEMAALYCNGCISFSEGLASFGEELRSVQPDFFFAVPRLWIKFKEGVDAKIPPAMQKHLSDEQKAGLRHQLGLSRASFILTGSAPCPRDVQQWFVDLGIWLRDGYGMTENFVHGCAWMADSPPVPGCVGRPMTDSIQARIGADNEIMFKSKGLMKGYYKEPAKTAEVLVDGWYRTGDTGRIDENGDLWVTGRLSEVFKTSKGKFIKPTSIEDRFGASPLLAQFCVFGHGLDQPALLVSLSESGRKLAREDAQKQLAGLLAEVNAALPSHERVGQIFVTSDEWQIGTGLLTPTMKLKRKSIEGHYRPWIDSNLGKAPVVFE